MTLNVASHRPGGLPALGRTWVRVKGLNKTFGSAHVLKDVDFEARAGEIHALVGQNGSGKSTLIKVLSGVHSADKGGVVEIEGTRVSSPVHPRELRRHGLAFVHQDLGLVGECTVLENMRLGRFAVRRMSRRIDWQTEQRAAEQTLQHLHSDIDTSRLVSTLQPAEKAVVAIGRALQGLRAGTGCVVFDESTRALPRELLSDFYAIIRRLAATGTAIIIVSHRLDEVLSLADRVTVLQDGRVVAGDRSTHDLTEHSLAHLLLGREMEQLEESVTERPPSAPALRRVLQARGLTTKTLLSLDFDVSAGEVVGVTGATGSGHAELPAVLAGLAPRAGGTVQVGDKTVNLPMRSPRQLIDAGVAFVPEDRANEGLALGLTAQENLTLPRARRHGRLMLKSGWQEDEFHRAVEMINIVPAEQHLTCSSFSGGNQQKILLAKWLLNSPRLVLLHEPTQAVDVGARVDILRAIRATAATGVGVVVISNEPQDLAAVCDRVVVLEDGAVLAELTSEISPEAITAAIYPDVADAS